MRLGAIDVGTNSIHLVVVELDARFGTARTILKTREMVRLGAGDALARGHLGKKAVQRGVDAITRFAEAARKAGAGDVRAVATSAVREAHNREEFVAAVRAASGVQVEILDEAEEARLIHLGVSHGYRLERVACIIDIGGGSTEFIVCDNERTYVLHSVRLGSLRLYEEFLRGAASIERAGRALNDHIQATLAPVIEPLADYGFETIIGTSGTIMGLAMLDAASAGAPIERTHGFVLRRDRLETLQRTMMRLTPVERRKLPGMNPRRSDIIVAGNAVLIAALGLLQRDRVVVCERALRDGIVVDYLERNRAVARKLGDLQARRFDAVHALAKRFGADDPHGQHTATLALHLFDQLINLHGFEPADRDLLFAAALLHDIGRAIGPHEHHKHGAYIVHNAGLPDWRDEEVALIGALIRYHRGSLPKPTHPQFAVADGPSRRRMAGLAGILRLADGLDVRRLNLVSTVSAGSQNGTVVLSLHTQHDVSAEIGAARFKAELFERTFGVNVQIDQASFRDFGMPDESGSEAAIDALSSSG